MKTIASNGYDQTLNAYIDTLYSYIFSIGNLSTYTVYNNSILVAKPTILNDFLPFFKSYSIKTTIDPKYFQKPNLFALDYYGASELEWLVLYVSGISHPIDFQLTTIDVLPVSMLGDLNKLITLYKKEVQDSRNNPKSYISGEIDISRQVGFIEERYIYKNDANLVNKLLNSASKNRLSSGTSGNSLLTGGGFSGTNMDEDKKPMTRANRSNNLTISNRILESNTVLGK